MTEEEQLRALRDEVDAALVGEYNGGYRSVLLGAGVRVWPIVARLQLRINELEAVGRADE